MRPGRDVPLIAVQIEHLLKEATGLDADALGRSTLARAIAARQHASGAHGRDEYWHRLRGSTTELGLLIEAVVVPETWFFRHPEAFVALTHVVSDELLRAQPNGALRLLSAPCSTGEEPYSMAMALLDAGVSPDRFHIDALDISPRALGVAGAGVFGKGSFRSADLGFRSRHFTATPAGYQLSDQVRARVSFAQANLLAPAGSGSSGCYGVVFCRNLLIYFDRSTQLQAVAAAARLLSPGGYLFVGPSETAVVARPELVSAKLPMAFAFRKQAASQQETVVAARPPSRPRSQPAAAPQSGAAPKRVQPAAIPPPARPSPVSLPAVSSPTGMEAALLLAEQGRFLEAAACCEEHVRRHGPSAQAFYLLGVVQDARGLMSEADRCYRKALYLDPRHVDALIHLALLAQKRGNRLESEVLHNRIRRLQRQGEA
jgi:chemotaxis protein methyltransferase WspC